MRGFMVFAKGNSQQGKRIQLGKRSKGKNNHDGPKICLQRTIFAVFEGWQSSINILAVGEAQASSEAAHDIPQADELKAA